VGELVSKGEKELLALRNFGQKSKQEIEDRLNALGLSLLSLAGTEEEEEEEGDITGEQTEGKDEA
jgi:DNA-directed RNA polymerase alpha subunit